MEYMCDMTRHFAGTQLLPNCLYLCKILTVFRVDVNVIASVRLAQSACMCWHCELDSDSSNNNNNNE